MSKFIAVAALMLMSGCPGKSLYEMEKGLNYVLIELWVRGDESRHAAGVSIAHHSCSRTYNIWSQ